MKGVKSCPKNNYSSGFIRYLYFTYVQYVVLVFCYFPPLPLHNSISEKNISLHLFNSCDYSHFTLKKDDTFIKLNALLKVKLVVQLVHLLQLDYLRLYSFFI